MWARQERLSCWGQPLPDHAVLHRLASQQPMLFFPVIRQCVLFAALLCSCYAPAFDVEPGHGRDNIFIRE